MKFQVLFFYFFLLAPFASAMEKKIKGTWTRKNSKTFLASFPAGSNYDKAEFVWKERKSSNFVTLTLEKNGKLNKKLAFLLPILLKGETRKEFYYSVKVKNKTTFFKSEKKSEKTGIISIASKFLSFSLPKNDIKVELTTNYPRIETPEIEII